MTSRSKEPARAGKVYEFFLRMEPPTATAQQRKTAVINGHQVHYDPKNVKEAKQAYLWALKPHRPPEPLQGPIRLDVAWFFNPGKAHQDGEWKTTRPDTDNMLKALKDCMTRTGFWKDDAQVCSEHQTKSYSRSPGIYIRVKELNRYVTE